MTPYTSYLATDGSERNFALPTAQRSVNSPPAKDAPMMRAESGAGAVALSRDAKKMKEEDKVSARDDQAVQAGVVKRVGVKTFYLDNGIWIDSEFKPDAKLTEVRLTFASDAFFDLALKEKDLAQFFSVGEQVVVVWKGRVYRITK